MRDLYMASGIATPLHRCMSLLQIQAVPVFLFRQIPGHITTGEIHFINPR